jgi:hypothetical protein
MHDANAVMIDREDEYHPSSKVRTFIRAQKSKAKNKEILGGKPTHSHGKVVEHSARRCLLKRE